jgi:hypothetical protein
MLLISSIQLLANMRQGCWQTLSEGWVFEIARRILRPLFIRRAPHDIACKASPFDRTQA